MMEDLGYTKNDILSHWYETCYEYLQVQSALFESFKPNIYKGSDLPVDKPLSGNSDLGLEPGFKAVTEEQVKGLPQGSPISPLLSSFILAEINEMTTESSEHAPDWIFYADDGLIYSDWNSFEMEDYINRFVVPKYAQWGINFNLSKSGWVKRDGEWLTPLKFVGLTWDSNQEASDGTRGVLRASTRKGATLVFDKEQALMDYSKVIGSQPERERVQNAIFYEGTRELGETRKFNRVWQEFKGYMSRHSLEWLHNNQTSNLAKIKDVLQNKYSILLQGSSFIEYESKVNSLINKYINKDSEKGVITINSEFEWSTVISNKCFGYILARLYCNSWGQSVKQDFTLDFKPESWVWHALNHKYDPLAVMSFYGGLTDDDFNRFSSTKHKYGYGGLDEFNPMTKTEFSLVRLVERFQESKSPSLNTFFEFMIKFFPLEDGLEDLLQFVSIKHLKVKTIPIDPKTGEEFIGPPLTVFNCSSYSLPFLVRLFDFQNELSYWRKELTELGLSPKLRREILSLMRLGHDGQKFINYYNKFLFTEPNLHKFTYLDDFGLFQKHIGGKDNPYFEDHDSYLLC
jgi:hypothetical protein